jgi:hypothetical protein
VYVEDEEGDKYDAYAELDDGQSDRVSVNEPRTKTSSTCVAVSGPSTCTGQEKPALARDAADEVLLRVIRVGGNASHPTLTVRSTPDSDHKHDGLAAAPMCQLQTCSEQDHP